MRASSTPARHGSDEGDCVDPSAQSFQCLDLRLLIDEHHDTVLRRQTQPDQIGHT